MELNSIFQSSDPEYIAFTIQDQLSKIINDLAPPRVCQKRREWCPFITSEIRVQMKTNDALLSKCIKEGSKDDWRLFHNTRITINSEINRASEEYKAKELNGGKRWKAWRKTIDVPSVTPRLISTPTSFVRKPEAIATLQIGLIMIK